eukprot:GHRR01003372.1.p1 GENE.GHRR01003372.1~~GHRR01003372.1.p1  ORF type:complete len:296 (+),score=71.11 GHRR01003372.1:250-1137(+)
MATAHRKLRVLCLHSWRTSGDIFKAQFQRSKLDVALDDLLELVFLTAPHAASGPIPDDVAGAFQGPYFEWFTTEKAQHGEEFIFTYHNMLESEAFIISAIRELGPFDGICGFSQGGAMASALVALQHAGLALPDVPLFTFALFFGSVLTNHLRYQQAFKDRVQVPSCHIIGHKDYVKEHSIALARSFEGPIVIIHSKGHVIPALANQHLAVLRAFLVSMQESTAALDSSGTQERQQQQMSTSLDPLDPPRPEWEAGQGRPRVPQQRASATSNSSQQQQDPVQHIVQPVSKVPSKL